MPDHVHCMHAEGELLHEGEWVSWDDKQIGARLVTWLCCRRTVSDLDDGPSTDRPRA